ncbi:kinesin-like protein KIF20A [Nematolebias whitei]|uniref:kinesin-like protein KIF20A n=1 Tax=Nematolebias whitei TaxID=451745 RepID=UPI00189930DD|nr:kinesin-like protein KIF20A [Nematolebias whitei]
MGSIIDLTEDSSLSVDTDLTDQDFLCSPTVQQPEPQMMQIYLRVRPFSNEELDNNEEQDCVVIKDSQTVALTAPKGSANMKSSEKGVGTSVHQFSFSKVFGPQSTQAELFEDTVKSQVSDFLDGKNVLIFSYGVTNAGKTFTIQGTTKEPGILPRALEAIFDYIRGHQYDGMDLKPFLSNAAQNLDPDQVKQERAAKAAVLASVHSVQEESDLLKTSSEPQTSSDTVLSATSSSHNQTALASSPTEESGDLFALWVSYFEIYNECVYDLFQPAKKRTALRVCDNGAGNTYVKDLQWINIQNLGEACKLLQSGNKNRSAAVTKTNQSSSRSHSIFTMKLLKIEGQNVKRISEFSLCDLAGSERCHKAKTFGERLKEAGNINNSLLILGKCITALRSHQMDGAKNGYIPFRESKLTKLFQAFFCGRGKASMIVNINQCVSTYDETLHIMKFSAIAKQVVQLIPDKPVESHIPCLFGRDGKPLESYHSEEELLDEDDEADVSLLPHSEFLNMIDILRTKLLAERRRNLVQEIEIRKEMGDAMLKQILKSEERHNRQIEELRERHAEKLENTFEMYKDAIKKHAYQCALNDLEDNYVPLDEFSAEQKKAEALQHKVSELESLLSRGVSVVPTMEQFCQTEPSTNASKAEDDQFQLLYKEKCAVERMLENNLQLISALEKRLRSVNETLQDAKDAFQEKSALVEDLQKKLNDQSKSMEDVLQQNAEKDQEISLLRDQLAKLSQNSPVQPKAKRGLLANIKEAVGSPRKCPITRKKMTITLNTDH